MDGLGCGLDGQRFALPTTPTASAEEFVQLIGLKDREERLRVGDHAVDYCAASIEMMSVDGTPGNRSRKWAACVPARF
jgi:hypothetical protein